MLPDLGFLDLQPKDDAENKLMKSIKLYCQKISFQCFKYYKNNIKNIRNIKKKKEEYL